MGGFKEKRARGQTPWECKTMTPTMTTITKHSSAIAPKLGESWLQAQLPDVCDILRGTWGKGLCSRFPRHHAHHRGSTKPFLGTHADFLSQRTTGKHNHAPYSPVLKETGWREAGSQLLGVIPFGSQRTENFSRHPGFTLSTAQTPVKGTRMQTALNTKGRR